MGGDEYRTTRARRGIGHPGNRRDALAAWSRWGEEAAGVDGPEPRARPWTDPAPVRTLPAAARRGAGADRVLLRDQHAEPVPAEGRARRGDRPAQDHLADGADARDDRDSARDLGVQRLADVHLQRR